MPRYKYEARDKAGRKKEGETFAKDKYELIKYLRKQNLFLTKYVMLSEKEGGMPALPEVQHAVYADKAGSSDHAEHAKHAEYAEYLKHYKEPLHPMHTAPSKAEKIKIKKIQNPDTKILKKKVSLQNLLVFTRQLAVSLKAGISFLNAMLAIKRHIKKDPMKSAVRNIIKEVQEGKTISKALETCPGCFPPLYISMVKAGEKGGFLYENLERLARYLEKKIEIRRKIISSLLYPVLMLFVATALILFMVTFIIPVFVEIFSAMGADLPLPTKIIIFLSVFIRKYGILTILMLGLLYVIFKWLIKKNPSLRKKIDLIKLKLPVIGSLYIKIILARAIHTLSALLSSAIPILHSLKLSKAVIDNKIIEAKFDEIYEAVEKGKGISSAMMNDPYIPSIVADMIETGEKTGELPQMLSMVAEYFDNEVDNSIKSVFTLLEPVLIILMGLMVGFIAVSLLLPIFSLPGVIH